jgi:hypothetical protein
MIWQQYYLQLLLITLSLVMIVNYGLYALAIKVFHMKTTVQSLVFTHNNIFFTACIVTLVANIEFFRHISLVKIIYSFSSNISPVSFIYLLIWFVKHYTPIKRNEFLYKIIRLQGFKQITNHKSNVISLLIILVLGILLYLSTLGFIDTDYYSYGFHSIYMVVIVTTVIIMLIINNIILGYLWSLALFAFHYSLLPSNNLWDYLLDPVIWLVSFCYLGHNIIKTFVHYVKRE